MKKPFKIPTILGLFLIIVLIGGLAIITQVVLRSPTQADIGKIPHDVSFSNVSDSGFTVTWFTDKPTRGIIHAQEGTGNAPRIPYFDERHVPGDIGSYTMHSVPVRGLKPETTYTVFILEHEKATIKLDQSYTIKTGPTLELSSNTLGPAYGSVMLTDGSPAVGSLVYLTLPGSQTLSTLVKPSGSFLIPLNLIRLKDATSYIQSDLNDPITVTVRTDSVVTSVITDTADISPIPEIMIGKTYDFRGKSSQSQKKQNSQVVQNAPAFSNVLGTQGSSFRVDITTPSQGAHITSPYPFFSGTGFPNMFVTLTIGMKNPVVSSTKVAADGTWTFTPTQPVGIGNQSVTVTSVDENKKPVAVTHLFEIMKSGTQVLGSATPSGTIVPTTIPTVIPTLIPTATTVITPTATPPITGMTLPTTLLVSIGLLLAVGGIAVLVL